MSIAILLADRTAAEYDYWLLASSCCPSVRLSVCNAVHCGSVSGSAYWVKSCTSGFLAGKLLFVPSDTCCRMYRWATKRTEKRVKQNTNVSFSRRDRQSGVHWSCYVLLLT